jgi:hypothetical protein
MSQRIASICPSISSVGLATRRDEPSPTDLSEANRPIRQKLTLPSLSLRHQREKGVDPEESDFMVWTFEL